MAIIGIGVDIVQVSRIARLVEEHGERFTQKVFTDGEIAHCERRKGRNEEYAGRWAAKEALMKALGTGWRQGIGFLQIENTNLKSGRPCLNLRGRAAELAAEIGCRQIHVTITHEREYAVAVVVLEG